MPAHRRISSAKLAAAVFAAGVAVFAASTGVASAATGGPGGPQVAPPSPPTTPSITPSSTTAPIDRGIVVEIPKDGSATVELKRSFRPGTIFSVAMAENLSTGYAWTYSVAPVSSPTVVFLDTTSVLDRDPPLPGTGGTRYFRFQAGQRGWATLTFVYQRSWEPEPIRTATLRVFVR